MIKVNTKSDNVKTLLLGMAALAAPAALIKKDKNAQVNQNEILNYLNSNPLTVANKVNVQKKYEDMTDAEIFECYDNDFDYTPGNYLNNDEIKELNKELVVKELRQIINSCAKEDYLTKELICLVTELNQLYKDTNDEQIKQEIVDKLKLVIKIFRKAEKNEFEINLFGVTEYGYAKAKLNESITAIDSVNMLNNQYVRYRKIDSENKVKLVPTVNTKYYKNNKEKLDPEIEKAFSGDYTYSPKASDFLNSLQRESFIDVLLAGSVSKDFLDSVYKNYYIKNESLTDDEKNKCIENNEKYNVKILVSDYTDYETLEAVDAELNEWTTKGRGQEKLPKVLDFNLADSNFTGGTVGYATTLDWFIKMKPKTGMFYNCEDVRNILRHELTHLNTKDVIFAVNTRFARETYYQKLKAACAPDVIIQQYEEKMPQYKLHDEIMKYKVVKDQKGVSKKVVDFKNCKYREEFLNAGIRPEHVEYAYKNIKEFLAVASEGDMSKYSEEFKKVLLKLNMPEFILKLEPLESVKMASESISRIRKDNPQAKSYEEISDVVKKTKLEQNKEIRDVLMQDNEFIKLMTRMILESHS